MSPTLRRVDRAEAQVVEGVESFVTDQDDCATVTAIAARGTAPGDELLPAKGGTAVASTSGADMNHGFV